MIINPMVTTLLMLTQFGIFTILMAKRWITWYWVMLLTALTAASMVGVPGSDLLGIPDQGPAFVATSFAIYAMGCMMTCVLRDLGVIESIVKRGIELGGDRPFVVTILLWWIWLYIAMGAPGTGPMMVTSNIIIPVLMTLGVGGGTAVAAHILGYTAAYYWWPSTHAGTILYYGVKPMDYSSYLTVCTAVTAAIAMVFITYRFKREGLRYRWVTPSLNLIPTVPTMMASGTGAIEAQGAAPTEKKLLPAYTFICPGIPVLLLYILKMDAIAAFLISTVASLIICFKASNLKLSDVSGLLHRTAVGGMIEGAPIIAVFFTTSWFGYLSRMPTVVGTVKDGIQPIAPTTATSWVIFAIPFGLLLLFRGGSISGPIWQALYGPLSPARILPIQTQVGTQMSDICVSIGACPTMVHNVYPSGLAGISSFIPTKMNLPWVHIGRIILLIIAAYMIVSPVVGW